MTLPASSRGTTYRLVLPWTRPPLTANQRLHHHEEARLKRETRETVAWLATTAKIPAGNHITAQLVWAPGDHKKRDEDNLYPTFKVCCDALAKGPRKDLVGLDLVPDDSPEWFTKKAPRIEPPPHPSGMWLVITVEQAEEATA